MKGQQWTKILGHHLPASRTLSNQSRFRSRFSPVLCLLLLRYTGLADSSLSL